MYCVSGVGWQGRLESWWGDKVGASGTGRCGRVGSVWGSIWYFIRVLAEVGYIWNCSKSLAEWASYLELIPEVGHGVLSQVHHSFSQPLLGRQQLVLQVVGLENTLSEIIQTNWDNLVGLEGFSEASWTGFENFEGEILQ